MGKSTIMIQARTGSTRLPKKVLSKIEEKPLIWHVINRVKRVHGIKQIVLVTTRKKEDEILIRIANKSNILSFTGDTYDVLNRYYQCASQFDADPIIRITGDCPLIDHTLVENMLKFYNHNDFDYVSNTLFPTFPDGLDVEIFSFKTLSKMAKNARMKSEREHVTSYILNHPKQFKTLNFKNKTNLANYRWTVDTYKDLKFVRKIYSKMRPCKVFAMNSVLKVISKNPKILDLNREFIRNEGYLQSLKNDKRKS